MTAFNFYQKIGIYPLSQTHPRIIPAITEISRAVGAPGVAMSTYQAKGVGLHKTGEACDFQAGNAKKYGSKYGDAFTIHNEIAKYCLVPSNWKRLKIRYLAWNGYEYGGSWGGPERKRKQTTNYGGSDPWHQHHVHVDFKPGAIKANPGIAVGVALNQQSKYYYTRDITGAPNQQTYIAMQRFLADRRYYDRVIDGKPGLYTWLGFQKFLKKLGYFTPEPSGVQDLTTARALQAWLTNAGHYKGPIGVAWTKDTWKAWQTYLRWAHKGTPVTPKPAPAKPTPKPTPEPTKPTKEFLMALSDFEQKKLAEDVNKTKMATGRSEKREKAMLEYLSVIAEAVSDPELSKSLRERVEQTNYAVGRIEKAYQAALKAEAEDTNE